MESMVNGYPKGWYDYKEIEWVEFHTSEEQLDVIEREFKRLGKLESVRAVNGIKLFAYQ